MICSLLPVANKYFVGFLGRNGGESVNRTSFRHVRGVEVFPPESPEAKNHESGLTSGDGNKDLKSHRVCGFI